MIHEESTKIHLKLEKDMIFKSIFGYEKFKELLIDETLEEKKELVGPNAATLLGLAVMSCLSASFLFCLSKRNLTLDDLEAHAEVSFKKIEKGYTRIKKIDVKIIPKTQNPEVLKRINQCVRKFKNGKMFFEETCIITPSVEQGIEVNVNIE